MDTAVFYCSGALSILASLLVVTRRNPVYGAIFLVLFFTTISLNFLILHASFLAVIQVLVYAGAIMVLYLFVIMLLSLRPEELKEEVTRRRKAFAASLSGSLFLLLAWTVRSSPKVQAAPDLAGPLPPGLGEVGTTAALGEELFRSHLLAFELTSILVLVAIIGAIYLTKRRSEWFGGPATPARPATPSGAEAAAPSLERASEKVPESAALSGGAHR